MNKKQIEEKIKEEFNNIEIPDLKAQILAQVPNRKVVVKEPKKHFRLAFHLSYIPIFLVLIISVIVISNSLKNNLFTDGGELEKTKGEINEISNVEKSYARQAATLIGFAGGIDSNNQAVKSYLTSSNEQYSSIAELLNKYLTVASNLLDEESTTYEFYILDSEKYKYKLVTNSGVLGDVIKTVMYYNETSINGKNDDDDEFSTYLEGVIEQEDLVYEFYGVKETEEDECEIELTVKIDDNNYLKVSQEIEHNEKEFEYRFYSGDPKKNKAYKTVEIEIEAKKISLEIKENGEKIEIEFKYNKNQDKKHIKAKYHNKDQSFDEIEITQDEEEKGKYKYNFGNGKSHSVNKGYGNKDKNEKSDEPSENEETHTF